MNSLSFGTYTKIFLFFFFATLVPDAACPVYAATALTNNASVAVSLTAGEEKFYSIQVPSGATGLEITLAGGSGDLDIYTRYAASPDTDNYDCRPYIVGNDETCSHANPAEGTWYIMVKGYVAGTSTLTATYTTGSSGSITVLSSDDSEAVSLTTGAEKIYSIQVPANATKLEVKIAGGDGDLDLYTQQGTPPNTGSYTCRPYIGGNNETCTHTDPAEGIWYIMVKGYVAGTSTLTATYTTGSSGSITVLSSGDSEAVSLATGAEQLYSIQVPSNVTKLEVKIVGGDGDLDLYTQQGTPPNTGSYTCRPYIGGNNETCTHTEPAEGIWYIMVRGYVTGTSTLTATYTTGSSGSITVLSNGVAETVSLATGAEQLYSIQVPANTTKLEVNIAGGDGDLDLYTQQGTPPNTGSYTCRPYMGGNNETCTHTNPAEGIWYVMVRGYVTGNTTLTATYESSAAGEGIDSGQLPATTMVWSSWYWPMKDSLNPNLYDNNEAMYRYDQYTGTSNAQQWEYDQHGPPRNPDGWWGHCHAWAAAACWEKQPTQSKTLDDVTFRIRDRKGLLIAAYDKSANGSQYEIFQDDPSPGIFWRYLQNEIAGVNPIHGNAVGFIGELYYGDQVWNHPIYAYEVEYTGTGTVAGKITISYATDFEPFMADSTSLYSDTLTYYFKDVVLSGTTPSNSGTWVLANGTIPSSSNAFNYMHYRPDAIWRPYKATSWATYTSNPHLDNQKLSNILEEQ